MGWLEVDKEGLRKLLQRKGHAFILYELLQNAWDQEVSEVSVKCIYNEEKASAELTVVDDDPEGFKDLAHSYTLFAESKKKIDPTKRGRFNLGEKFVLSVCTEAKLVSTKGTVYFGDVGERTETKESIEKGSIFEALIPMSKKEFNTLCREVKKLIPPQGIKTTFNGELLSHKRTLVAEFEEKLQTEIADVDGILKKVTRKTKVKIYEVLDGEKASIYEMGIPVVETGDKYHVDVQQKVPLNFNRDNVTPAYLRMLRTCVFNQTFDQVKKTEANDSWVREATSNKKCSDEAITKAMDLRYGKKRVVHDPSDPEATKIAQSKGYTLVPGRSLNKQEWANAKSAGAVKPASVVTPSNSTVKLSGGTGNIKITKDMTKVADFAKMLAKELFNENITVAFARSRKRFAAAYGNNNLTFNVSRLGKKWFTEIDEKVIALIIHEFGHHYCSNHLSSKYYDALCDLGAKLAVLGLRKPELFQKVTYYAIAKE